MNRTEAIVITAAIALATLPRFEAKVEQYARQHRTEIQMVVNQLEGKPVIPFAAPDASPVELAFNQEEVPAKLATAHFRAEAAIERSSRVERAQQDAEMMAAQIRAEVASIKPHVLATTRMQLAQLEPQLAELRVLAERNPHGFKTYRIKTKRCPEPPVVPAAPVAETPSADTDF